MRNLVRAALGIACLLPLALLAKPLAPEDIPEPLKPWLGWVLFGTEQRACPLLYGDAEERHCAWPSRLELNLTNRTGRFTARWQIDAASWAGLPGGAGLWPLQVDLDGKPVAVASRGGRPAVWLPPGPHRLAGRFAWELLPENLPVPPGSGLVGLTLNGRASTPLFNEQGDLWLQGVQGDRPEQAADSLKLRVFRRVIDEVPLRVLTVLDVEVAGRQREALLTGGLLPEAIPLALSSPLPARLEADGRLRMLLRPGRWQIELDSRQPGEVSELPLPEKPSDPWPSEEVWSFEAHPEIRVVDIEGASMADPRQTEMPQDWKSLPAYRVPAGGKLVFKALRRGDPEAAPDSLNLRRSLWLDFDGGGYTVHDEISGSISRKWRLDALPGLQPGRMEIDGEPQLLTQMAGSSAVGVELRRGRVSLAADSRGAGSRFPASGWARDFQSVSAELNLPPGWRLLAATGVDSAPGTWLGRWTLLDSFIVLVAALAASMLRGWAGGAVAAAALVLLWHEPHAPRYVWLHLLAAAALLQALPEGRVKGAAKHYRNLAALALAFIALPFLIGQVRLGLYPQLERGNAALAEEALRSVSTSRGGSPQQAPPLAEAPMPAAPASPPSVARPAPAPAESDAIATLPEQGYAGRVLNTPLPEFKPRPTKPPSVEAMQKSKSAASQTAEADPNALTQTGPGLPAWRWRSVALDWNGPVLASQEVSLVLLPPAANLLLNLLRVALTLALAWILLRGGPVKKTSPPPGLQALPLVLLALLCYPQAKAEMPSQELLGELKNRLLAPPECLPECAQITSLRLKLGTDSLSQSLEIHAHAAVAVPLPAQQGQWLPTSASIDGAEAEALFRAADGILWLGLQPGRHEVILSGPLPAREQMQLALPLRPHRVEVEGGGWQVDGLKENGEPEGQLQLTRALESGQAATPGLAARPLPPFLEVRRTLHLGLEWRVATELVRISPNDAPLVLDIPLLEGEAVTTPGLQVKNGKLAASLAPGQSRLEWEATLERRPAIVLKAPETNTWTEVWRAGVSPVWHLETEGIPVIRQQDKEGDFLLEWRPWPGELASLRLVRPKAAPGSTLTLESSHLRLVPGRRASNATLGLSLRSSQGGQHTLKLPSGAVLQSVLVDGDARPIRQQGQAVTLPIRPGLQTFSLAWRQDAGILPFFQAPEVDLGAPSVNSAMVIEPGEDRWVLLTGGPALGPAVLFWGVVAVLVALAWGLGRLDWTPLRARHWLLLLIGLSQVELAAAACVVGWLFALGWRGRRGESLDDSRFNAAQLGLALLSVLALLCLFYAVSNGLLGLPDMQVAGNDSSASSLNWYQDRAGDLLPRPWLVSAPLWLYRALMLLWALWLAHALLSWLRWGWVCYTAGGLWRPRKQSQQ